jgi:hypothetical protein
LCSGVTLDVQDAIDQATVEIGGAASRISSTSFIRAYRSNDDLRTLVNRHHAMFIAEGRQSVACNAIHNVHPRLCRWLANAQDQAGVDELELTQEFLARMLGVQRTTSTKFAAHCMPKGLSTPAAAISQYCNWRLCGTTLANATASSGNASRRYFRIGAANVEAALAVATDHKNQFVLTNYQRF